MSLYIDRKLDDRKSAGLKSSLAWHSSLPALAVASFDEERGGVVGIYSDSGTVINSDVTPRFDCVTPQVTCLQWHPSKKIIFVGYESGDLSYTNQQNMESDFAPAKHNCAVGIIRCSENGSSVVSGDTSGICVVWSLDSRGSLSAVFLQNLKEPITDLVFRNYFRNGKEEELGRLAQAAISGDEKALNMFSDWSSPLETNKDMLSNDEEVRRFFVGCVNGIVYYFSENENFENILQMDTSILSLLYYDDRDILIVVTEALILAQYHINEDGTLVETSKIKLSGRKAEINVQWVGNGVLSVCTGERVIHLWNVNTGHNNNLSLDDCTTVDSSDSVTSISFHYRKNILTAGSNYGQIISWKQHFKLSDNFDDETWQVEQVMKFQGSIRALEWCRNTDILGALTATDVYLVSEQPMSFMFKDHISAIQLSARQVALESLQADVTVHLLTDATVKAVYLSGNYVGLSTEKQMLFYEINFEAQKTNHIGAFSTDSNLVQIHEQSAYIITNTIIEIRTFQGTLKQSLSFIESEGQPIAFDICSHFLVACSSKSIIKIWDISRREAKLHFGPKLLDVVTQDKQILSIKCNHKGNRVSFTLKKKTRTDFLPDPVLYILDIDSDQTFEFDFGKGIASGHSDRVEASLESPAHQAMAEIMRQISGRYPVQHFWVADDDKLIACEAKLLPPPLKRSKLPTTDFISVSRKKGLPSSFKDETKHQSIVFSCYVTPEHGLLIQDHFSLSQDENFLLGIRVPYFYILKQIDPLNGASFEVSSNAHAHKKPEVVKKYSSPIAKKTMRDFVGMEECDKVIKEALLLFSYHLTVGNLDEAFRAIRVIKTESVWQNMARMCVKTKRLDVAKVCLGKMGHVRGAMALQKMEYESNNDVKLAVLAIHLGMLSDAENILISCKQFDLLNLLYQDSGRWDKALEVAEKYDRIHLRNTYYNYAAHLEFKHDINEAIQMYEKADVHTFEVPRMLFEKPRLLEAYVLKVKNKDTYRWWAQYLESIDEMESALQYYELAKDYLSLVRLYCYCNNLDKAAEIANETGDRAACFHVGRQFENQDNIKEAIHFFTRARAFNNAIRICKEHYLEDQLLNLALMSGPEEMIDVANYYERQEHQKDKAILLYHKAGFITKAVELAFKAQEHNVLLNIISELPPNTDQDLLFRCAQLFLDIKKYDKAVELLASASHYQEALRLCLEHNIILTDEQAEKLTPSKENDTHLRMDILEKIGDCCAEQENYHLAAKKYTQAGKKVKATKALLKSGDTEKIIFFASVSRQKEIYIMAANYLQTLNWRQDPNIMKHVISFYTKAKCFHHLSSFYEACAQDEIDEYQNYEKAYEALTEAYRCFNKADAHEIPSDQLTRHLQLLKFKTEVVKQFVQIQQDYLKNPEEAIKHSRELLQRDNIEMCVRRGDIYGFIIEHFCGIQNYKAAYELILDMKNELPGSNLSYYIKTEFLDAISKALSIDIFIDERESNESLRDDDQDYQTIEDIADSSNAQGIF